jgi:hypothetical protein
MSASWTIPVPLSITRTCLPLRKRFSMSYPCTGSCFFNTLYYYTQQLIKNSTSARRVRRTEIRLIIITASDYLGWQSSMPVFQIQKIIQQRFHKPFVTREIRQHSLHLFGGFHSLSYTTLLLDSQLHIYEEYW